MNEFIHSTGSSLRGTASGLGIIFCNVSLWITVSDAYATHQHVHRPGNLSMSKWIKDSFRSTGASATSEFSVFLSDLL
jgi:hypothetical protein